MADIKTWLEIELTNQFRPVMAPDSLWDRIQSHPAQRRGRRPLTWPRLSWISLAIATLLLAVVFGFRLSSHQRDPTYLTDQDFRDVSNAATGSSFPSGDPAKIRKWLKDSGNFDIPLPSVPATRVRLLGAKLVKLRGSLVASVAYHVGGDNDSDNATAILLVRRKKPSFWEPRARAGHELTSAVTSQGASVFSWSSGNQNYAIASAEQNDTRGACLLCHAEPPARL
jgi:hypothetical protein